MVIELEKQMKAAAKNLEFEKAAQLRDQVVELRKALVSDTDVARRARRRRRPRGRRALRRRRRRSAACRAFSTSPSVAAPATGASSEALVASEKSERPLSRGLQPGEVFPRRILVVKDNRSGSEPRPPGGLYVPPAALRQTET